MIPRAILSVVLLLLAVPLVEAACSGANSCVQSKQGFSAGSASVTAAFPSNVTAGNLIAVACYSSDTAKTLVGITDTLLNTYTNVDSLDPGASIGVVFTGYAKNIAGGANTVTCTVNSAPALMRLYVHEVSGRDTASPLEQHGITSQVNPGTGVDGVTTVAVCCTTVDSNQYIFSSMHTLAVVTESAGTGYTLEETDTTGGSEDQVQAVAGAIAGTFTLTVNNAAISEIMTFKAASTAAFGGLPTLGIGR